MKRGGPSTIGISTIYKSKGDVPEAFLRGAGVSEDFTTTMKSLAGNPINFYSWFVSHPSKERRIRAASARRPATEQGRCWFAPEDVKIGDKFRTRIDESIRIYDKLMVILTEHSIASSWVEDEVEAALEKERKQSGKLVLFLRLAHSPERHADADRPGLGRQPAPHAAYRRLSPLEGS